jgi:hypothetical protein
MATLNEIRNQYPQYADLPDDVLANALYKKFYSDIPRAEFDSKLGIKTEQAQVAPTAQTPPPPTSAQTMYRNVRNVIAPTVEMVGAVGGGLLGTPLGPMGAVGGAGLGYGIAKEALQLGDVYFGGQQPRQGAQVFTEPAQNILEGATYETGGRAIAPYVAPAIQKVTETGRGLLTPLVKGVTESDIGKRIGDIGKRIGIPTIEEIGAFVKPQPSAAEVKAASIASQALGQDLPKVLSIIKNAPEGASVAEITASLNNPTWQALVTNALERDPQFLRKVRLFGEEESLKALSKLAGGTNASEVRGVLETAKKNLNAMTTPQREAALDRANLGKQVSDYEATAGKLSAEAAAQVQKVRDLISAGDTARAYARLDMIKRGLPVGASKYTFADELAEKAFGEWSNKAAQGSLDLGQGARFNQQAADALRSVGIKPLEGEQLVRNISSIGRNPNFAGNDLLQGAIKNVADDIAQWTASGGVIDARALDAIRKNSVNAAIARLRPGMDANSQRNLASSVLSDIRPALVDAIEQAGGKGYRQYLADYTKGMQTIAQRKLTGEAMRLYKTNPDEFVRLVQNESPEAVEKILGSGKYNIAVELADSTMGVLRDLANKRLTQLSVSQQSTEGQKALAELVKQNTALIRLPSFINVFAAAGNKAISEYEKALGAKTMKTLTEAMKTPQGAANLLDALPTSEKNRVTQLLTNPSTLRTLTQSTLEQQQD